MSQAILIHNYHGWYWEEIERYLRELEINIKLQVAHSRRHALDLFDDNPPDKSVLLCQPLLRGRTITPLLSQIRIERGFAGPLYVIGDRIDDSTIMDLARLDVDGLIRPAELPGSALHLLLGLLVTGAVRIATRKIGLTYYRQLAGFTSVAENVTELTPRQTAILRAIYTHDNEIDVSIASHLDIHVSTFKRELNEIRSIFGKQDRLSIGVEAARRGILP